MLVTGIEPSVPTRQKVERSIWALLAPVFLVGVALAALLWGVSPGLDAESFSPLWFVVPFVAAEVVEIRLRHHGRTGYVTMTSVPLVVGFFLVEPFWLLVVHVLATVGALVAQRLRVAIVLYNATIALLSVASGLMVMRVLSGHPTQLGVRSMVAVFVGAAAVALVSFGAFLLLDRLRGRSAGTGIKDTLVLALSAELFNATFGFIGLRVIIEDRWSVVPVALLVAFVVVAYRAYSRLLNNHESLERLYESTRDVERPADHRASIQALLDQTLELLGADLAELAFLPTEDHPAMVLIAGRDRHFEESVGPAAEHVVRERVSDLLGAGLGPSIEAIPQFDQQAAAQLERQTITAALNGPGGLVGSIRVSMNHGGSFTEADRQLLEMFANHASVALHNAKLIDRLRAEVAEREHQALHDGLTALPNRVMFDLQTRQALDHRSEGELVAVVLVDLDRFKEVNDTLGHDRGDELLEEMGQRLSRLAADEGLTVARLGGDEFAVLLRRRSDEGIRAMALRVQEVLEAPIEIAGVLVDVGASLGVAVAPADGDDATTLLQRADVAMYVAKSDHRDVVFYEPETDPYSPQRLSLAADLRRAVAAGEIEPHFQPVTSLATGEPISVEALARWTHPTFGVVPPDVFIPIAEQSGLIRELTFHMLDRSLYHVRRWRTAGLDLRVAVNLSVRQLGDDDLVESIAQHLALAGVAPSCLTLEVTEGTIMSDPARAIAVLEDLHALGVGLSIDDFGTGYSSLNQLKRMPVTQLKIDRSFVSALPNDRDDAVIVQSVINLGHNLGMRVVAEGVENRAHLDYLRDLGCDYVQGYYLSPPLPSAELLHWMRRRPQITRAAIGVAG